VGPLDNVTLTSSTERLDVPITRQPGDVTPAGATVTTTASDGQFSVRDGYVYQPYIRVLNPINSGWPAGPVTMQIDVTYSPWEVLLGCQNATCTIVSMPASLPPVTTVLTLELSCASSNGLCP
jgi:hypothetical protein